ncbi:MAG: hypothetical protein MZU79_05765 [Anaerotruncus sp.]|nr:hypothetical protein [Anaerotruncus sp.]
MSSLRRAGDRDGHRLGGEEQDRGVRVHEDGRARRVHSGPVRSSRVHRIGKQYLLGIVPIFWPLKAVLNEALMFDTAADAPFWFYMVIGASYTMLLGALSFAPRIPGKKSTFDRRMETWHGIGGC